MTTTARPRHLGPLARGFALPMVLLLALIASLGIVVLLNRQGADNLAVKRYVNDYRNHHLHAGLSELIHQWMVTTRVTELSQAVTPEGLAFKLDMPDRGTLAVYFYDAQGAGLTATGALGGRERDIADRVKALLRDLVNSGYTATAEAGGVDARTGTAVGGGTGELIRSVGPAKVSINSATDPVLRAIAMATIAPERVEGFMNAMARGRERGRLGDKELGEALKDAGLTPQETQDVELMLTVHPTLWRAICIKTTALGVETERTTGMILVLPKNGLPFERTIQVLSWESLPTAQ